MRSFLESFDVGEEEGRVEAHYAYAVDAIGRLIASDVTIEIGVRQTAELDRLRPAIDILATLNNHDVSMNERTIVSGISR